VKGPGYRYYPERGVYEFTAAAVSKLIHRAGMSKDQAEAEDAKENNRRRLELIADRVRLP
jgi:hypothetical protein